jgi:predicted RNA methylase
VTTGKNFSCNNVAGKRRKSDFYETPYSMTDQMLDALDLDRGLSILEPACGEGAISTRLAAHGYGRVTSYDLLGGHDFLQETRQFDVVLTNPPYSLADAFIAKALEISDRCVFLLPLSYLHGKRRYDKFYQDTVLAAVHVFVRYPMLGEPLRSDGKYHTGMMVYAWFDFDKAATGGPVIRWLDNDCYVLRAV